MSRKTIAKKQILEFIEASDKAVSHSDLHKVLSDLCDRVTIYRVLDRLVSEGSIHKIVNTDGVINYAACKRCEIKHNHNHVHFSCESCKVITCLNTVEVNLKLPMNYVFREAFFTVSGICSKCSLAE